LLVDVIATGARSEELAQAQAWVLNGEPLFNSGMPLPGRRVSRLIEIPMSLDDDDQE
jgi:hypothetical protein